jgi:2-polyprenyl-6-methoxyphenol hydroxylase-like FAD-dependent oxidoreductase
MTNIATDNRTLQNRRILISGASVAGPSLAWWLARHGFRPTVVERAPQLRGGGYAVDFRGAAHLSVLTKMGILDRIRERQTHLSATTYVDADGRPVASMPAGIFAGDVEILRGDLGRILYEATRGGTEYLFGDSITGLHQDAGGVHVTFRRAAPQTFDLVIGADGLHSAVRELAFGDYQDPVHDLGLYVSIFGVPDRYGLDHEGLLYSVPGRTAAIFSAPGTDEAVAQFFFTAPDGKAIEYDYHVPGPRLRHRCPAVRIERHGWDMGVALLECVADRRVPGRPGGGSACTLPPRGPRRPLPPRCGAAGASAATATM